MAEEVKKILENSVAKAMEGMNITFPMAYHDRSWYGTWLRPKDALDSLSNSQIPPPVTLEQKRHWPVGTEDSEIPRKELLRQHHKVPDPHYIVPPSKKELLPPQPVYPQSRGIKLRDVDTIVKESKYLRPTNDTAQSRKPQQQNSNFKKPEASSRQQPSSSTDNNSTVASILHDIYSASQPQPKPSTSSSHNSTSLRVPKNEQRNRPTPTKSTSSSSSSSNAKKNAPSPAIKKSTSKPRSNVSSNNNSLSEPENNYRTNNNDPHPYTNLIQARSNLLNDDPLRNRALEDLRRAKEQVAAASKPNLPLHILTFDDYTYNLLGDRESARSENAEKKRPLTEKTRSSTPDRRKIRKTTGGKVVPPRRSSPARELEEGETISPSPSPTSKRIRDDDVPESRKKRPVSPIKRSRSPPRRRSSPPRRRPNEQRNASRSPVRKVRSDRSVSRSSEKSKPERRRSSLTRVDNARKRSEREDRRDRDTSVDSKTVKKRKDRPKKGDELEDIFASAAAADQRRNTEQKEMREEKLKEEKLKEEKLKEEKLKQDKLKEEKLREDKLKEDKLKEDKLKEEKLKEEKLKEEKLKEERLKEEKLKEEKLKEEKLKEDKLKEERLREEEKLREEKLKQEKLREEKLKEEKLKQDKLKQDKLKQDKVKEEKLKEDKIKQDKVKEERIKEEKYRDEKPKDERSRDSREERRDSRPSSSRDRGDRKKKSSDESKKSSSSSKLSSSRSKDTASEKVSTPQLKSRSSSSASTTEKEALSKHASSSQKNSPSLSSKTSLSSRKNSPSLSSKPSLSSQKNSPSSSSKLPSSSQKNSPSMSSKPSPAESNASKESTSSSTKAGPSATAPNAETIEQYRVFTVLFKKLAHYNKRQGDSGTSQPTGVTGLLDHLHSLCNYILSFYYFDKQIGEKQYKQSIASWQSLFPFADAVVRNLEAKNEPDLLAVAKRLLALVRFHVHVRMETLLRPSVTERLANTDSTKNDNKNFQEMQALMSCYDRAQRLMRDSEKVLNYAAFQAEYPLTFKRVCIDGDLSLGITVGGEAGVTVTPLYPFAPYTSQLNHAAIAAKCLLSEFVEKNSIKYDVVKDVENIM